MTTNLEVACGLALGLAVVLVCLAMAGWMASEAVSKWRLSVLLKRLEHMIDVGTTPPTLRKRKPADGEETT